jgi:hypothetical protein
MIRFSGLGASVQRPRSCGYETTKPLFLKIIKNNIDIPFCKNYGGAIFSYWNKHRNIYSFME